MNKFFYLFPAYAIMYIRAVTHYYKHEECEIKLEAMYDFTIVLIESFGYDTIEAISADIASV